MDRMDSETGDKNASVLSKWCQAVELHSNGMFREAIDVYRSMPEMSPAILFNMAMAHLKLEDSKSAIQCLTRSIEKDQNFAIAFFMRGVVNFDSDNNTDAVWDFELSKIVLRGNSYINYRPLGLFHSLHVFEILYNLAVTNIAADDTEEARRLLTEAIHDSDSAQRKLVTEAFKAIEENRTDALKLYRISADKVFVPPKEITENLQRRKSSRGSKVVFASDENDTSPSFQGSKRLEQMRLDSPPVKRKSFRRSLSLRRMKSTSDMNPAFLEKSLKRSHSTGSLKEARGGTVLVYNLDRKASNTKLVKRNSFPVKRVKGSTHIAVDMGIEMVSFKTGHTADAGAEFQSLAGMRENTGAAMSKKLMGSETMADNKDDMKDTLLTKVNDLRQQKESMMEHSTGIRNNVKGSFKKVTCKRSFRSQHVYGKRNLSRSVSDIGRLKEIERQECRNFYSRKSTGDLTNVEERPILPLEPKITHRTSYRGLKKLSAKCSKRDEDVNEVVDGRPAVLMSGCNQTGELVTVIEHDTEDSDEDANTENKDTQVFQRSEFKEKSDQKRASTEESFRKKPTKTLGSVFGDKSTVVKYALTEACNVLTAFVTPTVDESELNATCIQSKHKYGNRLPVTRKSIPFRNDNVIKEFQTKSKSTKLKKAPGPPNDIGNVLTTAATLITAVVQTDLKEEVLMDKREDVNEMHTDNEKGDVWLDQGSVKSRNNEQNQIIRTPLNKGRQPDNSLDEKLPTEEGFQHSQDEKTIFCSRAEAANDKIQPMIKVTITEDEIYKRDGLEHDTHGHNDNVCLKPYRKDSVECTKENMGPRRKAKSAKQAKGPPKYPPPPLRMGNEKIKGKRTSVPKNKLCNLVNEAIVSTSNTLGAVVVAGSNIPDLASAAVFDKTYNIFNFGEIPSVHDYVNIDSLNEKGDNSYINVARDEHAFRNRGTRQRCYGVVEDGQEDVSCVVYENVNPSNTLHQEGKSQGSRTLPKETGEIQTSNGVFRTSCQLLADFVNSSAAIHQAFTSFIQNGTNNNVVWCMDGHLKTVEDKDKPHEYENLSEIARL